ncbi:bromodomain-containing protein 8 [Cyclopterus lumpus]|uniref:bromodomain-containing protein 8 n=1 Tax=Cyclopterus lumpus TaxID=8103 RepID=UPI0014861C95|nr:bromodomain-containing protein 8 [Cyclopterus lumpus]
MANGVGKHKLLVIGPTEPWSAREKLCLATSVMKSGDQNWVSVSRAIKPFAEPGRPPDWFSQKHCASKYSELLQTIEAPKRKRGERGEVVETVEDVIVRRLTADRIDALKKLIKETQETHRKLKRETELIQAGCLDSKLEELWEDILQKKKLEEKEAELKRKITNAAYQARQVAKNSSKREPGITIHSLSGCSSPSQEFSPGDRLKCLTLDLALTKSASGSTRLMTIAESSGPGNDDISPGSLLDDPTQKKLLVQKATPPPSPLLSELLKKGSILATNSRLIGEGDVISANMTGAHDLQLALPSQPLTQATEVDVMVLSLPPGCQPISAEDKVAELGEEGVTVSYMGDELDLKTVGDIIAIIEDKTDVTAEALDAAAVEAALSLCEENGHALSGAWEPTGVQQSMSHHSSLEGKTDVLEVQGGTSVSLSSLCNSQDSGLAAFPMGLRGLPHTSSSSRSSKRLEHCRAGAPPQPEAMREIGMLAQQKSHISLDVTLKRESEKWAQRRPEKPHRDSVLEDSPLTERHPKGMKAGGEKASGTNVYHELNGPEVCGDEEADGVEGFLSEPDGEMELEPAASESEDGYSLHTASSSLQLHTTADSIPSSPASSQFSVCSEDHEALQAHKIWKKAIMLVWRAAANHRYANVFLQPVTHEIAPGYHSIVQRPMDLAAIKKSIETGLIRTTAEFQRDIMLMFQNAVMYNSLDHDVYHMALEMQRDVLEQIQQFLATQLIMETSDSGISAKSLRGRESTRKQDSTDKDTVSMSSPAFLLSLFDGGTRGRRCAIEADLKMKK